MVATVLDKYMVMSSDMPVLVKMLMQTECLLLDWNLATTSKLTLSLLVG